jgi:putative transposase
MPRKARVAPGGLIYHVLNSAAGRKRLFHGGRDFAGFERVMQQAWQRVGLPILSYCILPNHWHFIAAPREDGELTAFFRWLANTHAMRWRVSHRHGPLYQGRFKSFPIQRDEHLLTACRYVERNALSAGLVQRAEDWRWGSLWARCHGGEELKSWLAEWPVDRPRNWVATVNAPLSDKELQCLQASETRGRPFGSERWIEQTVRKLDLRYTIRPQGRPKAARQKGGKREN